MSEVKLSENTSPSPEEVYQSLLRSLKRRKGFGIVFVQCSPAEGKRLIQRVQRDLPQKQMETLTLDQPIRNLYDIIANLADRDKLNLLFIEGLEKSLEEYIKPGYRGDGDYYNMDTVPPILNHLNQRREIFRDRFTNLCFVFILPYFAIKYFIRRAPDFFDWSAGVFAISSPQEQPLIDEFYKTSKALKEIKDDFDEFPEAILDNLYIWEEKYEQLTHHLLQAFNMQGKIGDFFGKLSSLKALYMPFKLNENYKLPLSYCDRLIEIYLSIELNRGNFLKESGRWEEAINSYNRVIEIQENLYQAWYNKGDALEKLGQWEKAIPCYNKVIEIKPDFYQAIYKKAASYGMIGNTESALENLQRAIEISPHDVREWAKTNPAFKELRLDPRFQELMKPYS